MKTCLTVDMVRKNWSGIVAGCGLHYFVLVHFEFLQILVQLKDFIYLFFTAIKNHTMAHIIKKQNFIFSSLATYKLVRFVSPLLSGME